jgi:spore coat assembly protein SafA
MVVFPYSPLGKHLIDHCCSIWYMEAMGPDFTREPSPFRKFTFTVLMLLSLLLMIMCVASAGMDFTEPDGFSPPEGQPAIILDDPDPPLIIQSTADPAVIVDSVMIDGSETTTHVVQQGETLESIAAQYGLTTVQIHSANPHLDNSVQLFPGTSLVIPPHVRIILEDSVDGQPVVIPDTGSSPSLFSSGSSSFPSHYTVQPGDSLSLIASRYGIRLEALLQANPQITNPDLVYPGQTITIPPLQ